MASGINRKIDSKAVGVTEQTIVAKKAAMANHANDFVAIAVIGIVEEEVLPSRKPSLHGANCQGSHA